MKPGIDEIAVVGAGLMGHGIALEFAVAGHQVRLNDVSDERLQEALGSIDASLELLARTGLVTERDATLAKQRIETASSLEQAVEHADLVIEAVSEDLELKTDVFRRMDRACDEDVVLASNTSSFMPSQLAAATSRPQRVLVAHYFNPPYLLPLVEVVPGPETGADVVEQVVGLLESVGKRPVVLRRELPGFVVNRLQTALQREALSIVEAGVASPEDIDVMVRNSFGRRLAAAGPFEVFDAAGWDVISAVMAQLLPNLETSAEVPTLVKNAVKRGDLGVKSGRGFYRWDAESQVKFRQRMAETLATIERLSRSS